MDNFHSSNELELLTIKDVSNLFQIKESTLRSAIFKKEIPYLKIGALVRFKKNELLNWLNDKAI